jgi:hypothetical protein
VTERHWLARPALSLLILACGVSVMASGRFTLRLILPSLVYASFVPLLQMLSLAILRGPLPWRRAVDLFFAGHTPWSLWILASAAWWGLVPAQDAFRLSPYWRWTALVPLLWSAHIDYRFFRKATPDRALLRLAAQRAICWLPGALLFVAPAGWQILRSAVGL